VKLIYTVIEVKGLHPGIVLVTADRDGFQPWPSSEAEQLTYKIAAKDAPRVGDVLDIDVTEHDG
jgi:hypothetical protein